MDNELFKEIYQYTSRLEFLFKVVEDTQNTIRFLDTKAAFCVTLLTAMMAAAFQFSSAHHRFPMPTCISWESSRPLLWSASPSAFELYFLPSIFKAVFPGVDPRARRFSWCRSSSATGFAIFSATSHRKGWRAPTRLILPD